MIVQQYLDRIQYQGEVSANLQVLKKLMKAHLLNVPFENLDIHRKVWIELDAEKIYNKIVRKNRGGFCYELNGNFYQLLMHIGFQVEIIGAQVYFPAQKTYSPPTSHMALLVHLDGQTYLVDVGFGDFVSEPIKIGTATHHTDPCGQFKLTQTDSYHYLVEKYNETEAVFVPQYIFTRIPYLLHDFTHSCYYQQLSPDSHFTQNKVCSLLTSTGRKTITQSKFIVTVNGNKTEELITDEQEFNLLLQKEFNISLN